MTKISANDIFTGFEWLGPDWVLVVRDDGTIIDLLPQTEGGEGILNLEGILCPGFVNAHCHIELSHLEGKIPEHTGLPGFLENVVKWRESGDMASRDEAMASALRTMAEGGIVAVGDVCNTTRSLALKFGSGIYFHSFCEALGVSESDAGYRFGQVRKLAEKFQEQGLSCSISPHAPYSVSGRLMRMISGLPDNRPISIHNQESRAENDWFRDKSGDFNGLFAAMGIDVSGFKAGRRSSLQTWLPLFTGEQKLILVHNTFTSGPDIEFACNTPHEIFWCLCPASNLYIGNALPDIPLLYHAGCRIVLGTDSLASNTDLSILAEMKIVHRHFPGIPVKEMLGWATSNGASALGAGRLGSLSPGMKPGVLLLAGTDPRELSPDTAVTRVC